MKSAPTTTARWLGAAFLFVLVISMVSGVAQAAVTGAGGAAEALAGIHTRTALWHFGLVGELVTSAGILTLAALLYAVLRDAGRPAALVALAWWIAEGVALAVTRVGGFALVPLADALVSPGAGAGVMDPAAILVVAEGLRATMDAGYDIHMLFYLLGAVIWFALFYRSRVLPRPLAIWGILAESVALVAGVVDLMGVTVHVAFFAHLALLELVVGGWLVVWGADGPGARAAGSPLAKGAV